jgi:Flp pilus assembly protein TadD
LRRQESIVNRKQRRAATSISQVASARVIDEGIRRHRAGRLEQASALYLQALAAQPGNADVLHLLGGLRLQQGNLTEAAELNARAVAIRPNFPEALSNLASALSELGKLEEAADACRRAIAIKPNFPGAHVNLGIVLKKLGRHLDAEASFQEALRLQPDLPDAHYNLGILQEELGRPVEAEASLRTALRLQPDSHRALVSLGVVLRHLGRVEDAESCFAGALRLKPNDAESHLNLACTLLLAGRMADGWEHFEWRWKTKLSERARDYSTLWKGEPIRGRAILLHAEQGLGDTLQFCRYAPRLAAAGAKVILQVPPALVRLLSRLPGVTATVARGDPLPPFDLHCPLMSLPRASGTTLDTIPGAPYLEAEPALSATWRERLAGLPGVKVGLVWAGGRRANPDLAAIDARRSITLNMLAPLGEVPGVSFISLQKGEPAAQAASHPPDLALHDFTAELGDFADTAALVDALDLVISVDTSVAHLAGGLGKPVWLLNRFDTDWRWLLNRDDSPWYPTLRQFRQPSPLDWEGVIVALREALSRLAAGDLDQLRPRSATRPPD